MQRGSLSMALLGALAATMVAVPMAARAQYGGRSVPVFDGRDYANHDDRNRGDVDRGDGGRRIDYDRGFGARGEDRGGRCRSDGGAIIGAIAGGLLGNAVAGYGDRAAGTILGGGGGALAGRAIDRDC